MLNLKSSLSATIVNIPAMSSPGSYARRATASIGGLEAEDFSLIYTPASLR